MANNYYNFPVPFIPGTKVRSEQVNVQLQGIQSGFDLLPADPASMVIGTGWFSTDAQGATVNDYLITTPNPQTALVNGQRVAFFATHTNTLSTTINVDGLGVVNLVDNNGSALVANDIISGQYYEAVYDNANTRFVLSLAAGDSSTFPQITATGSDAIDLVDAGAALRIGAVDPTASQHIEVDSQSIQSKSNGTTAAALGLNPLGGAVFVGGSTVAAPVFGVNATAAGDPQIELQQAGAVVGFIGYDNASTDIWIDGDAAISIRPSNAEVARYRSTGLRLTGGDLAINEAADHTTTPGVGFGLLWTRTSDGALIFTDNAATDFNLTTLSGSPGGATTQVQYNNAGAFGGMTELTYTVASGILDYTNVLTSESGITIDAGVTTGIYLNIIDIGETLTSGTMLSAQSESASAVGAIADFRAINAGNSAIALNLFSGGTGTALNITQSGAANAIAVVQSGIAVAIDIQKTADGSDALMILGASNVSHTGDVLQINNDGSGYGIIVTNSATGFVSPAVGITGAGTGDTVNITSTSTAAGTTLRATNSGTGNAIAASANVAARVANQAVANFSDQNASSAGDTMYIGHSPTDGNSRGIHVDVIGSGNDARGIMVSHAGTGIGVRGFANNTAAIAFQAYSNIASRTQPLVEIINDNATGTGVALSIQQDQGGVAIELIGVGQIKFPATAVLSTDPNTIDDYRENDFTATATPVGSGSITLSGAADSVAYTRTGRDVHVQGTIQISSVLSPTGTVRWNILPFTAASLALGGDNIMLPVFIRGLNTLPDGIYWGEITPGSLGVNTYEPDFTAIADSEWVASVLLSFNFSYITTV